MKANFLLLFSGGERAVEQKEIVSRLEKHLANVTELEKQIAERETLIKQMLQSIMKDAFREE